ncbi:MAG: Gfo/Idh/MocA family protein [Alcaligenes aquatilis]
MNVLTPLPAQQAALGLGVIGGSTRSAVGYAHWVASHMDGLWAYRAGSFSRDAQTCAQSGQVYGVDASRLYTDWTQMLAAEQEHIDAVLILSPTPAHADMVIACLERGLAVICEKALACDSAQAQRIVDAQRANQGFLAVTYNYSGYPMMRELRQLIECGTLGQLQHFHVEMPQEGFIRVDASGNKPAPQAWRLSDGRIPTIYLDLAVHLHQLVHYLTQSRPESVVADQASHGWFDDVVDDVSLLARYKDGLRGQFWFSKSAMGHRNGLRLRLFGSKGSAEWLQVQPEELHLAFADGTRQVLDRGASQVQVAALPRYTRFKAGHPAGFVEAFANLYADIHQQLMAFRAGLEQGSPEVQHAELALEGLQFLEAAACSAHEQRWCSVPY